MFNIYTKKEQIKDLTNEKAMEDIVVNPNAVYGFSPDPNSTRLAKVKKSNLETYGNENGPTAESLFEKYGSWEKVLIKSFRSNSGMDACLGDAKPMEKNDMKQKAYWSKRK